MKHYETTSKRGFWNDDVDSKAEKVDRKAVKKSLLQTFDKKWTITTNETALLSDVHVDRYEILKQLSWRIKRSVSFLVVYIIVTIANAGVLIWELSDRKHHYIILALEAFVILVFLLEIALEILAQTAKDYFSQCWNLIDASICLVSLMFFAISFSEVANLHFFAIEIRLDTVLISIRYFVQIVRLCRFVQNARTIREIFKQQDIKFESNDFENF